MTMTTAQYDQAHIELDDFARYLGGIIRTGHTVARTDPERQRLLAMSARLTTYQEAARSVLIDQEAEDDARDAADEPLTAGELDQQDRDAQEAARDAWAEGQIEQRWLDGGLD